MIDGLSTEYSSSEDHDDEDQEEDDEANVEPMDNKDECLLPHFSYGGANDLATAGIQSCASELYAQTVTNTRPFIEEGNSGSSPLSSNRDIASFKYSCDIVPTSLKLLSHLDKGASFDQFDSIMGDKETSLSCSHNVPTPYVCQKVSPTFDIHGSSMDLNQKKSNIPPPFDLSDPSSSDKLNKGFKSDHLASILGPHKSTSLLGKPITRTY
ncbi:hypothetical protein L2E82_35424 [Cichorium intybus]|uniref:Uncharacterized protein n=1 Tax=Cichorium intybus TaxID=13427 RepID=A0ACB9BP37_CICIN|nr:hypothetical protein L2E82_35424 [Cichorium intybus]